MLETEACVVSIKKEKLRVVSQFAKIVACAAIRSMRVVPSLWDGVKSTSTRTHTHPHISRGFSPFHLRRNGMQPISTF